MAIGERIHFFRTLRGITQKSLGQLIGFNEKTADIRIAQYESGKRSPKDDITQQMAHALDVSPYALTVPDIDTYLGLMHTLFTLEDCYGLTIANIDGQICIKPDINHPAYSMTVAEDLHTWAETKSSFVNGSITREEYDHWRYHYPEDMTTESKDSLDTAKSGSHE